MSRPGPLRRRITVAFAVAAAAALAVLPATSASAGTPELTKYNKNRIPVQLLSFNDFHGHVEQDSGNDGSVTFEGKAIPANGASYLATHLKQLRKGHPTSFTVAAGDLIGGSTFTSGVFHDEPAVEVLDAMGMDISGVGNHEFDEGVTELRRMMNGGCHPVDGCFQQDATGSGHPVPRRGLQVPRRERGQGVERQAGTGALRDQAGRPDQDRLHRHDPGGHRRPGLAGRHRGLRLHRRGEGRQPGREGAEQEGCQGDRRDAPRGRPADRLVQRVRRHVRPDRRHRLAAHVEGRRDRHRSHPRGVQLHDQGPEGSAAQGDQRHVLRAAHHRDQLQDQHEDRRRRPVLRELGQPHRHP